MPDPIQMLEEGETISQVLQFEFRTADGRVIPITAYDFITGHEGAECVAYAKSTDGRPAVGSGNTLLTALRECIRNLRILEKEKWH